MTQELRQESKSISDSNRNTISGGSSLCPRCGKEIIATGEGVAASFPSPAIERLICSGSGCNYVKYVKLNSNGFAPQVSPVIRRGDQRA